MQEQALGGDPSANEHQMRTYHYTSPSGPITVDPLFVAELIEAIPLDKREEVLEPWRDFMEPTVFGRRKKIIVDETQFAKEQKDG